MSATAERPPDSAPGDAASVKSLARIGRILDCFSTRERTLGVGDIALRTGLPKTTVHRLLAGLREIGFVEQDGGRERYRLGIKLFALGSVVLANMDLHREARPFVERLMRLAGETVHLCVFDGRQMVLIEQKHQAAVPGNLLTTIEAAPAHCTGVGKAALAFQPQGVIERVVGLGLRAYTPATIVDADVLQADLARVRERGYAVDDGEHQPGLRCVAAPIRNASGAVFAAISVSALFERLPQERIASIAPVVIATASSISHRLGWRDLTMAAADD